MVYVYGTWRGAVDTNLNRDVRVGRLECECHLMWASVLKVPIVGGVCLYVLFWWIVALTTDDVVHRAFLAI